MTVRPLSRLLRLIVVMAPAILFGAAPPPPDARRQEDAPASTRVDVSALPKRQRPLFDGVTVHAKFVRGSELKDLDRLIGTNVPAVAPHRGADKEIYLIARLDVPAVRDERFLWIDATLARPERHAGVRIRFGSTLGPGSLYGLAQVIDADELLPDDWREQLLIMKPELKAVEVFAK